MVRKCRKDPHIEHDVLKLRLAAPLPLRLLYCRPVVDGDPIPFGKEPPSVNRDPHP